jgi:hypothetical protein
MSSVPTSRRGFLAASASTLALPLIDRGRQADAAPIAGTIDGQVLEIGKRPRQQIYAIVVRDPGCRPRVAAVGLTRDEVPSWLAGAGHAAETMGRRLEVWPVSWTIGGGPVELPFGTAEPEAEQPVPPASRVPRTRKGKHAVFVGILTDPLPEMQDEADQPLEFDSAWCIDAGLTLVRATARAQRFNLQQLRDGMPRGEWAFVLSYCRPQGIVLAGQKGGAQP